MVCCEAKAIAKTYVKEKMEKACVANDKQSVKEFSGDNATVAKEVVKKYAIILEFCSMLIHPCPLPPHHQRLYNLRSQSLIYNNLQQSIHTRDTVADAL